MKFIIIFLIQTSVIIKVKKESNLSWEKKFHKQRISATPIIIQNTYFKPTNKNLAYDQEAENSVFCS